MCAIHTYLMGEKSRSFQFNNWQNTFLKMLFKKIREKETSDTRYKIAGRGDVVGKKSEWRSILLAEAS